MGFFGGDNEQQSQAEQLANETSNANKAELENKKRNLYKNRLDIIKAQGSQQWHGENPSFTRPTQGKAEPFPFGGSGFLSR